MTKLAHDMLEERIELLSASIKDRTEIIAEHVEKDDATAEDIHHAMYQAQRRRDENQELRFLMGLLAQMKKEQHHADKNQEAVYKAWKQANRTIENIEEGKWDCYAEVYDRPLAIFDATNI